MLAAAATHTDADDDRCFSVSVIESLATVIAERLSLCGHDDTDNLAGILQLVGPRARLGDWQAAFAIADGVTAYCGECRHGADCMAPVFLHQLLLEIRELE